MSPPTSPVVRDAEDDQSSAVSDDESSEDDLVLDGELVRNPDAPPSSDDEDDDDDDQRKRPAEPQSAGSSSNNQNNKKQKKEETLQVEFIFCDMAEKFFHGLKNLLHNSSSLYQQHSSNTTDLMIQNVSVGTVVSTSTGDKQNDEDDVFGFASVLNVTTFQKAPALQLWKTAVLDHCPPDRKSELQVVLSGSTNRPAGFILHARMLNLPLEMVLTLHQQLVQDIDWAVENAEGGKEEQKSLDFGIFLRLAPCQRENSVTVYKYFDDEVFAERAEFVFHFRYPPSKSDAAANGTAESSQQELVTAMVLTKAGHRAAIDDLVRMINGPAATIE